MRDVTSERPNKNIERDLKCSVTTLYFAVLDFGDDSGARYRSQQPFITLRSTFKRRDLS